MLDFKEYLTLEAYSIPISKASDIDNFDTKYPKKEFKKLLKHVKSLKLDDIPIVGSDGTTKSEIGKIKIRGADPKSKDEISQWVQDNTTGLKGSFLGYLVSKLSTSEALLIGILYASNVRYSLKSNIITKFLFFF